jgi:hypothetical protein
MNDNLRPLRIYPNWERRVLFAAVFAVIVVVPILILRVYRIPIARLKPIEPHRYMAIWIGIRVVLVAGALGLSWNLWYLFFSRPVVTLTNEGITALWFGEIRWTEIDHVAKVRRDGQSLLGIFPHDLDALLAARKRITQYFMKQGMDQGFPAAYVNQRALPISIDDLLDDIRRYSDVSIGDEAPLLSTASPAGARR